jgi:hypothetical protein
MSLDGRVNQQPASKAPSIFERIYSLFARIFGLKTKKAPPTSPIPELTEQQRDKIESATKILSRAITIYSARCNFPKNLLEQDVKEFLSLYQTQLLNGYDTIAISSLPPHIKQLIIVIENGQPKGTQANLSQLFQGSLSQEEKLELLEALRNRNQSTPAPKAKSSNLPPPNAAIAQTSATRASSTPAYNSEPRANYPYVPSRAPSYNSAQNASESFSALSSVSQESEDYNWCFARLSSENQQHIINDGWTLVPVITPGEYYHFELRTPWHEDKGRIDPPRRSSYSQEENNFLTRRGD